MRRQKNQLLLLQRTSNPKRVSYTMFLDVCRVLTDLASSQTMTIPSPCGDTSWCSQRTCLERMRNSEYSAKGRIWKLLIRVSEQRILQRGRSMVEVVQRRKEYGDKMTERGSRTGTLML